VFVYRDESPDCLISFEVTDDGKFLILYITQSCDPNAKVWVANLDEYLANMKNEPKFLKLVDNFDSSYSYLANDGNVFYFETTLNAPRKRIVKCDIADSKFEEVVKETEDVIAFSAVLDHNKLVIVRLQDVKHAVSVYELETGKFLYFLPVPSGCMINSLSGKRKSCEFFYSATSFISPGTSYRFDFKTQQQTVYRETQIKGLKSEELETTQVFYNSKDGTKIPMFLTHKKGIQLDGSNPVLLYAYGGFNHAVTPSFSASWVTFAQNMNGIVAVANIRGGSEYGQAWYDGGRLGKKQNCFDDFQSAAKFLVEKNYTTATKICINGGSNGGLLVAACANEAPELFGCCIADVGII
jgi:prolyl oligopeptidase